MKLAGCIKNISFCYIAYKNFLNAATLFRHSFTKQSKKGNKEHITILIKFLYHHCHSTLFVRHLITTANCFFISQTSAILRACQLFFNDLMVSTNIRKSNARSSQIKAFLKLLDIDI